jgi:hypothetical protein
MPEAVMQAPLLLFQRQEFFPVVPLGNIRTSFEICTGLRAELDSNHDFIERTQLRKVIAAASSGNQG